MSGYSSTSTMTEQRQTAEPSEPSAAATAATPTDRDKVRIDDAARVQRARPLNLPRRGSTQDEGMDHDEVQFAEIERSATVTTTGSSRPYSAFSTQTKWVIAVLAGVAGLFSPISSNIFVPSIPSLARDFHRSNGDISLGVTVYLVFQAVTPSFFGAASDSYGRRPVLILTLAIYIGANVGLALMPTSAYWLLLFLRALQSTGGSGVIAIGAGAIADIAEPKERGKFMAIFQGGAMVGPAIGPFLGGLFAETLGWRAIFWFLVILTACVLVPVVLFFPETLRSIVGDGSIPPPTLNASPITIIERRRREKRLKAEGITEEPVERPPHKPFQPLSAFWILFNPELLVIFTVVSVQYLAFYCLLTVFSTALEETYHLNELMIGLCYLPSGAGTILTVFINGKQLDYYYRKEMKRVGGDYRHKPHEFRIELTRIRCFYPFFAIFVIGSISMGWCLQAKAPLAATLVLQFLVGLGTGTIGTATVYGQDILPGKGGAVSASLNLVRCAFAAIGTATVIRMYNNLGAGWSFVLLGGLIIVFTPLSFVVIKHGAQWREWRAKKAAGGSRFYKSEAADNAAARREAAEEGAQGGEGQESSPPATMLEKQQR